MRCILQLMLRGSDSDYKLLIFADKMIDESKSIEFEDSQRKEYPL